ncbi:MAG: HIT family protein [Deltaproteobacteria bacterium]|nr:HIT family protein [Deltaproteobacteria bacterium]
MAPAAARRASVSPSSRGRRRGLTSSSPRAGLGCARRCDVAESTECVFCRIVRGEAPAHVVAESPLSLALLDVRPLAAGHCLVISRRHEVWWHDLTAAETADLFGLARRVARRLKRACRPDFVATYARGRRIPHVHLFLVPSFAGDPLDRHFNALEGWQEGADALAALADPARRAEVAARLAAEPDEEAP